MTGVEAANEAGKATKLKTKSAHRKKTQAKTTRPGKATEADSPKENNGDTNASQEVDGDGNVLTGDGTGVADEENYWNKFGFPTRLRGRVRTMLLRAQGNHFLFVMHALATRHWRLNMCWFATTRSFVFFLKWIQLIEADPAENNPVATQLLRNQEVDLVFV